MAHESRIRGSQVRKLIFSYGTLFGGILGLLSFSTPSYANLLSGIDSAEGSAQSNAQGTNPEVRFQMAVQSAPQGSVYDSEGEPLDEPGLFGSHARYSYVTKAGGLSMVYPTGFGGWPGQFSSDGTDGNDGNEGDDGNDGNDDDGEANPFSDIIVPDDVVHGNVADASDLLTEVNFRSHRYGQLLKSL